MLGHGLRPHLYCMPVVKTQADRLALVAAATSGEACFFLGTDSAPHALGRKLAPICAAGVFNAPVALETYAEVFDKAGRLDRLEAFASLNGPAFYRLSPNETRIRLERTDSPVAFPQEVATGAGPVTVFDPGRPLHWRLAG